MSLRFERLHYEHIRRLFSIIDTESVNLISRDQVKEFVALRCPVFRRRDESLRRISFSNNSTDKGLASCTFDEVWSAVVTPSCKSKSSVLLGIEGFLVFCRLIALAQYQEAKQRFSQRHSQQTLRHKSDGNEVVMVNVPPPSPPSPISLVALKQWEDQLSTATAPASNTLPLPELDLNHCLVAAHDDFEGEPRTEQVHISVFPNQSQASNTISNATEFTINFLNDDTNIVRRTLADLAWLRDTFASHQSLGGTLCGRILPPFPKTEEKRIILGLGMISTWTKGLLGRSINHSQTNQTHERTKEEENKARRFQRCLNYLLEHPSLKTSFPLNAVLKASQTGLDAAKRILEDEMTSSHSSPLPLNSDAIKTDVSSLWSSSSNNHPANLCWIRTAAQAAMALKLHGILDATGYASASARLQHASLPSFDVKSWRMGESCSYSPPPSLESSCLSVDQKEKGGGTGGASNGWEGESGSGADDEVCFETGVVAVESELDDDLGGFDLLPSSSSVRDRDTVATSARRFHYGFGTLHQPLHHSAVVMGGVGSSCSSVDDDIDKLREIIGAMDTTLERCLAASTAIENARRKRDALHLGIVRGLDSWGKGEFIAERALLKGVQMLERSGEEVERCNYDLNDGLAWQSSLASSAVSAAEDVRCAVRAARTATGAKAAAESAALHAQNSLETSQFSTQDEARAAQTRASISHSHAIHASIIEHEAFAAKRKAAMALAHDIKCWNSHRKREMLRLCLTAARRLQESRKLATDAWTGLLKGMHLPEDDAAEVNERITACFSANNMEDYTSSIDPDIITHDDASPSSTSSGPKIVPVDHKELNLDTLKASLPLPLIPNIMEHDNDNNNNSIYPQTSRSYPTPRQTDRMDLARSLNDRLAKSETMEEGDVMTASMQSLVDGLMNWGGRYYDPQDDLSLPSGMAMSIALEESGVLNPNAETLLSP